MKNTLPVGGGKTGLMLGSSLPTPTFEISAFHLGTNSTDSKTLPAFLFSVYLLDAEFTLYICSQNFLSSLESEKSKSSKLFFSNSVSSFLEFFISS